jgi:aspartate/methionine/tyrosine aminotransferase
MAHRVASRMQQLGTETAFEVLVRARALEAEGREVIHLEIGEPDFDTPGHIVRAAQEALEGGWTHYGPALGQPDLRTAIAKEIADTRGIAVDPRQVVVTPGAKPIMFYTIMALAEPGDEVIYPNPGFPIYESMITFVGATPVPLPLREAKDFRFDPDEFRALVTDRTRLEILNSPANPTGGVLDAADLRAVAEVARERDLVVLADEIYGRILYEGQFASIASLDGMAERTVILDGFSKTYAMTGWRLGYGVFPEWLLPHVDRLIVNSVSCTASFAQRGALAALTGPQDGVARMVEEFRRRRNFVVAGLNRIPGITCRLPLGAFYAFPNITGLGIPSKPLADFLLQDAGVAVLSGTAFGQYGEGYLRLSYANSIENLGKALERIAEAVTRLPR